MQLIKDSNIDTKGNLCIEHDSYLQIIFHLGKGVMLVKQLQEYMFVLEGQSKSTVYKRLRKLESSNIIEIIRYYNNNYIKLRKYALEFVTHKEKNNIKSITVNPTKLKRSIFHNAYILNNVDLKDFNAVTLIDYLLKNTTIFLADKKGYKFLEAFKTEQNQFLRDEIAKLKSIRNSQLNNLTKSNKPVTKFNEPVTKKGKKQINLNNMQSRNIHIVKRANGDLEIVIFDTYDNYTAKKLTDNMKDVWTYLNTILGIDFQTNLSFRIFVVDKDSKHRIERDLNQHTGESELDQFKKILKIENLNLTSIIYANSKIIFG